MRSKIYLIGILVLVAVFSAGGVAVYLKKGRGPVAAKPAPVVVAAKPVVAKPAPQPVAPVAKPVPAPKPAPAVVEAAPAPAPKVEAANPQVLMLAERLAKAEAEKAAALAEVATLKEKIANTPAPKPVDQWVDGLSAATKNEINKPSAFPVDDASTRWAARVAAVAKRTITINP